VVVAVPDVLTIRRIAIETLERAVPKTNHIELLVGDLMYNIYTYTFCSIYHTMNHSFQFELEVYLIYNVINGT